MKRWTDALTGCQSWFYTEHRQVAWLSIQTGVCHKDQKHLDERKSSSFSSTRAGEVWSYFMVLSRDHFHDLYLAPLVAQDFGGDEWKLYYSSFAEWLQSIHLSVTGSTCKVEERKVCVFVSHTFGVKQSLLNAASQAIHAFPQWSDHQALARCECPQHRREAKSLNGATASDVFGMCFGKSVDPLK